jgi:hypothetical protein
MPTGYTQGILDGTITDFKGFASTCMRAFGAAMHMREEGLDQEYRPAEPSDYHQKQIVKWTEDLEAAQRKDPKMFYYEHIEDLKNDIADYEKKVVERKAQRAKLDDMLAEAQQWTPPTEDHQNFKSFMVDQLKETIKWDGDWKWYQEELEKAKSKLEAAKNRDIEVYSEVLKEERIGYIQKLIDYHTEHYNNDVKKCNDSNQWVKHLIESV